MSASERGVTLEADGEVSRFDAAGRLRTLYDGRHVFRRGLDNSLVEKWWSTVESDEQTVRIRESRTVDSERRDRLVETAYQQASTHFRTILDRRESEFEPAERESIRRVLQYSPETLAEERETVTSLYAPVGVLPPDQYNSLVLQPTTGCPYDCSFCTLYSDSDLSVRSVEEFDRHAGAVKSFFGRGLQTRRTVFLGDADPLAAPLDTLEDDFVSIERTFPRLAENGIYAFLTVRTAATTSRKKLNVLAENGLDRVYIGVESGADEVLALLRKPQTSAEVQQGIERVKAAGIDVGAIVLGGVGGEELAPKHRTATGELVDTLPLDADDILYVSPLATAETDEYASRLREASLSPLTAADIAGQAEQLRAQLADRTEARVSRYQVSEFVYF